MTASRVPNATHPGCEAYGVLRSLSLQGKIVGRELTTAREALMELGLSDVEGPAREHDGLLLTQTRRHDHRGAFLCLRCRVSWPLEQRLKGLHRQFAANHGLELVELAAFVLDDVGHPLTYGAGDGVAAGRGREPFGVEVIRSYAPELSSLATWAKQRLLGHPPLRRYLSEQGVRLMRDWALLGDASHAEVRRAVEALGQTLTPETAEQLHRRYLDHYKCEKLLYRQRTGRQQGWQPDEAFLRQVRPEEDPEQTRRVLLEIASLVRRHASGRWEKQDSDLLDGNAAARWRQLAGADPLVQEAEAEQASQDRKVLELVERVGRGYTDRLVAELKGDPLQRTIWAAWAEGLRQRQIVERYRDEHPRLNQSRVSRTLQEERRASEIATEILSQLRARISSQSDETWAPAFRSLQGLQEAEARLMNHLLQPEQPDGVSPLRRWVRQSLASSSGNQKAAPTGGSSAGEASAADSDTGCSAGGLP